jgi:dephospho-CoA kinase
LPRDEKTGYADFVIDNRKDVERTRKQVEGLCEEPQKIEAESQTR